MLEHVNSNDIVLSGTEEMYTYKNKDLKTNKSYYLPNEMVKASKLLVLKLYFSIFSHLG